MGPSEHFPYVDGRMTCEGVDLAAVAEAVGTPVYCYSRAAIERQFCAFRNALAGMRSLVCFAMKANSNQAVLRILARLGAGMDVVSIGELRRARAAGAPGEKITYSGVGKTAAEIEEALDYGIFCFNVESEPELAMISRVAQRLGKTARIALRVNPDVDAKTHAKISTGAAANKFGVPISRALDVYREAAMLPNLRPSGVDMHIGSQITDLEPFDSAFEILADFVRRLRADGHQISHVDLGGGLGVPYREGADPASYHPDRYAEIVSRRLGGLDLDLIFEPGRLLVANAGALLTRVIYVKSGEDKTFLIVDAAMNDLIRPTLYDAHHEIAPLRAPAEGARRQVCDVVGPVCETGDYLAQARDMPPMAADDLAAVLSAGAYGAVQAGTYNSRLLAPEVLIDAGKWSVIRPRATYDDLIALDRVPPELA